MQKFSVEQVKLMQLDAHSIRNLCIIAHVDHGKTTLADMLVAGNDIISYRMAGKLKYLDSRRDEQERGITMKSSSITLHHKIDDSDFLINLIDSPGHVDFSAEISTAVHVCDGAILVVDVVEGVCPQTKIVLRKAWLEGIQVILVLNKIDRLIVELKMAPYDAYIHLQQLVEKINAFMAELFASKAMKDNEILPKMSASVDKHVSTFYWSSVLDDLDDSSIYFCPEKGNVIFCSAQDGWGFNSKDHCIKQGAQEAARRPLFVQLVLERLWQAYDVLLITKNLSKVEKMINNLQLSVPPRDLRHNDPHVTVRAVMSQWLPLSSCVLGRYIFSVVCLIVSVEMAIRNLPSPKQLSPERIDRLLQSSVSDSIMSAEEVQKLRSALQECSNAPDAPIIIFISKMVAVEAGALAPKRSILPTSEELVKRREDIRRRKLEGVDSLAPQSDQQGSTALQGDKSPKPTFIAFGRVFSGTVKPGLSGLENVLLRCGTLTSLSVCPAFTECMNQAAPILRVAVEPVNPAHLSALVDGLHLLCHADPGVEMMVQDSGEHVLITAGEVHLQRCLDDLEQRFALVPLHVSEPLVPFRETIVSSELTETAVEMIAPGGMLRVCIKAVPLPHSVCQFLEQSAGALRLLDAGQTLELQSLRNTFEQVLHNEGLPWACLVDHIWSWGPKKNPSNILFNGKTDYKRPSIWNKTDSIPFVFDSSIVAGFQLATLSGPLCEEPMTSVAFIVEDWEVDPSVERQECCRRAFQMHPQRLVAAMYSCNITATSATLGKLYGVLNKRFGRIVHGDQEEGSQNFNVTAFLPVIESFDFANEIRKQTSGMALPQLFFSHWEVIPEDPFWVPSTEEEYEHYGAKADSVNRARKYMNMVRRRKGLPTDEKLVEFGEKQRTLTRMK